MMCDSRPLWYIYPLHNLCAGGFFMNTLKVLRVRPRYFSEFQASGLKILISWLKIPAMAQKRACSSVSF